MSARVTISVDITVNRPWTIHVQIARVELSTRTPPIVHDEPRRQTFVLTS
jgi:hypothetical protein